ncbi:ribonuclease HI family protein [Patescibacteria group bacterium]
MITSKKTAKDSLFVYCDGGARGNPGPAGAGFLVKDKNNKILVEKGVFLGRATNNVAEYRSVIEALKWLVSVNDKMLSSIGEIKVYLDSQLVVNQLNGIYKIKNANLRLLIIKVKALENQINPGILYFHIPREKNSEADFLVNKALDHASKIR